MMKAMFEKCKNLTFIEPTITITSAMTEQNKADIARLAAEMLKA